MPLGFRGLQITWKKRFILNRTFGLVYRFNSSSSSVPRSQECFRQKTGFFPDGDLKECALEFNTIVNCGSRYLAWVALMSLLKCTCFSKVKFMIKYICYIEISRKLGCGAQNVGSLNCRYHLYNITHICIFLLWEDVAMVTKTFQFSFTLLCEWMLHFIKYYQVSTIFIPY